MPIADIVMFVEDNRLQCLIFYTNDFSMTSLPLDDVIKLGAFSLDSDSWRHGGIDAFVNYFSLLAVIGMVPEIQRLFLKVFIVR